MDRPTSATASLVVARPVQAEQLDVPARVHERREGPRDVVPQCPLPGVAIRVSQEPGSEAHQDPRSSRPHAGRDRSRRATRRIVHAERRVGAQLDPGDAERGQRPDRCRVPDGPDRRQAGRRHGQPTAGSRVERAHPDGQQRHLAAQDPRDERRRDELEGDAQPLVLQDAAAAQHHAVGTQDGPEVADEARAAHRDGAGIRVVAVARRDGHDLRTVCRGRHDDGLADRLVAEVVDAVEADEENPSGRALRRHDAVPTVRGTRPVRRIAHEARAASTSAVIAPAPIATAAPMAPYCDVSTVWPMSVTVAPAARHRAAVQGRPIPSNQPLRIEYTPISATAGTKTYR